MSKSGYVMAQSVAVNQFIKSNLVSVDTVPITVSWVSLDGEVLLEQTYPLGVHKPADLRSALPDAVQVEVVGGVVVGHGVALPIMHTAHNQTAANPNYQAKAVDPMVMAMRREFAALQGEVRRLRSEPATHLARQSVNRKAQQVDDDIKEFKEGLDDEGKKIAEKTGDEKAAKPDAAKEKEKQD